MKFEKTCRVVSKTTAPPSIRFSIKGRQINRSRGHTPKVRTALPKLRPGKIMVISKEEFC